MAVMAVEAVGDAAEGGAARTAGRHAARRARPAAARANRHGPSAVFPSSIGSHARSQGVMERGRRYGQERAVRAAHAAPGAAARRGREMASARIPGDRNYQPVILAEFLVAVMVVALVPLASGGQGNSAGNGSASPYAVGDLTQLVALGATYFILALLSSGSHGRLAAWLGGIIVLGLGLNVTRTGGLTKVFAIFGNGGSASGGSAGPPSGAQAR